MDGPLDFLRVDLLLDGLGFRKKRAVKLQSGFHIWVSIWGYG